MTPCRKGLHDLDDPANVGTQRSTGRQFCRACKREYRRARRAEAAPAADLCRRGLHDMADAANVYVRPGDGRRECRACKAHAAERRKEARAAEARAEAEAAAARRALLPRVPRVGGGEAGARARLAVRVRAGRGLL